MILTRLNVLKTSTGASYIDSFRGEYSKEEMAEIINAYVERLCSDASIEKLKEIQLQFVSYNEADEAQALSNFVKSAKGFQENWRDTTFKPLGNEGKLQKIKGPDKGIVPSYWDSDEAIKFEEVYKLERGTEYSQYKVEQYVQAKTEMETVINAFNKKQQFVDFTENLRKEELTFAEKEEKLLAGYAEFYALSEDGGLSQLQKIIDKSKLPIAIEDGKLNLSGFPDDASKTRVLNQLLKLAGQEKEFKAFLGDKSLEQYQADFEQAGLDALGPENGKLLAEAMKNDNLTVIERYTGNASMAGMALTVVGGVLCFTPAAPLGATLVTAGNTLAIGGMVAKTGLGVADYATKKVQTAEELEDLGKNFLMDAGGFIIGMKAGKAGMNAFNKLIDKKLAAVFGEQIASGNKMQALKTVFTNPEYLKSFMTAGGAKLGTDFVISYAGDLAMIGVLDTKDDWRSLLQANLTGILVGMSGDVKDAAGVGKGAVRIKAQNDVNVGREVNLAKGALTSDAEAEWLQKAKSTSPAENAEKKILSEVAKTEFVDGGIRLNTPESLDAELDFAMKKTNAPVENLETLSLVINGKLGETLKRQYEQAGKVFSEVITKNSDKIAKIEQKYANDKQKLAEEFTHLLADELGVTGIEPKIEIVKAKDENAAGYFDWTKGKLLISEKVTNPKDIETIIAHEFVHVIQFKDIVAAKGHDGVREIIMKNNDGKYVLEKTKEFLEENGLDYDLETPEDQAMYREAVANQIAENILEANAGLRDFAQKHPLEKGSLNEYLARIYKSENENMAAFETEAYYNQVIENEAYFLGNGKLGTAIKVQLAPENISRTEKIKEILNQDTDEVRTMINKIITKLRQTSSGEDITLKINGEEQVYQAYKGNIGNNGGYYVTDGKNVYTILSASKAVCDEKMLANELYNQLIGCFPKEEAVVETDTGYAIMSKGFFSKAGFIRDKTAVKTYAMDALLGNMENVVVSTKDPNPITISNNAMINLLHHPNGNPKQGQVIIPELSMMFQNGKNATTLKQASKEELVASLQQVVDIPNEKLLEIVNNSQVENKEQLGDLLIKRKEFINNFLNNLKNTEQAGLPIEEHMHKVYQKTYAEYRYDNLKTNTEFTELISKKFDIPKQDLLGYQKILNNPELAQHITEKINDGLISKEDLIEFNEDIGNFQYYWQESPTLKKEIFDALIDLKNEQGINMKDGYILVLKIAQNDRVGQFSKDTVEQIKIINKELNGNTNAGLYRLILNDGTIDKTKLDLIKDFQSRGIDDKYLVLLTEHVLNPDRTINNEKLTALKGLFDKNIKPEDIPMYFTAINTPEGFDANMVSIIDKYKELGLDNEDITRNILSSRVRTKEGFVQKTHALEIPLLFPDEITNVKLLNAAVREFSLWAPNVGNTIKKVIEKNPDIKLADLVTLMQTFHKDGTFDSDGYATAFRLLEDGVTSSNMSSFIAVSKITANPTNALTSDEALKQTIRLRSTGEILIDSGLTPTQAAKLLDAAKTEGKIDKFALDMVENQFKDYTPEELLCLINYSKILPQDGVPLEVTNSQRQQILDNITDIMKNKGFSVIDACKSISQALNLKREVFRNIITGINENTLAFCKRCTENDIEVNDIQLIAYNSRILDNVSNLSPEEINAKHQKMLNWAEKLLFEDKLPAKTVAKLIDTTAFKTQGKIGVRPATYNFDDKVIKIIDRMIDEKAITPDSSADISKIILAFKNLDYDPDAIAKTMDLLKNPITLKNGKQYDIDAESIGYFIGGSKNKETGRFDIDIFNKNVDIYIL